MLGIFPKGMSSEMWESGLGFVCFVLASLRTFASLAS